MKASSTRRDRAFDRTLPDELPDDVINGRVQQVVGVPALKTLRRGLPPLPEKSGLRSQRDR